MRKFNFVYIHVDYSPREFKNDSGYLAEGKGYDRAKVIRFFKNWTPEAVNK